VALVMLVSLASLLQAYGSYRISVCSLYSGSRGRSAWSATRAAPDRGSPGGLAVILYISPLGTFFQRESHESAVGNVDCRLDMET
jgi:hypothetical protein